MDFNVFLEGEEMINDEALAKVRSVLESNIGEKVKLKGNGGRKKYYTREGVIFDTYPSVFTVKVDMDGGMAQTLSYTYWDVLTSDVELIFCKDNQRI